jgi:predicted O-methyltransferase YrrM
LINPIQKPSIEAASDYEAESLDFVYIDASHDYDNVVKDINAWYPKIKPSGILAGDDYGWSGVERAVKGKFGDNFIVEAKNNWIHSKLDNFDYEDFMINKLAKKNRLFKILGL